MEGSLYGVYMGLFFKASFITDHNIHRRPPPGASTTEPPDQTFGVWRPAVVEAARQDSPLGDDEVMHAGSQSETVNGMTTTRTRPTPPQEDLQPLH